MRFTVALFNSDLFIHTRRGAYYLLARKTRLVDLYSSPEHWSSSILTTSSYNDKSFPNKLREIDILDSSNRAERVNTESLTTPVSTKRPKVQPSSPTNSFVEHAITCTFSVPKSPRTATRSKQNASLAGRTRLQWSRHPLKRHPCPDTDQ